MTVPAVHSAAVALGRAFRRAGMGAGVEEEMLFCRALGEVDVRSRAPVYWAARSVFVRRLEDVPAFDAVF